jgi:hypothetical protein
MMTEQQFEDACNVLYSGNHATNRDDLLVAFKQLYQSSQWQPISTAPKDGSWIIGTSDTLGRPVLCRWNSFHPTKGSWESGHLAQPTHWIPLPKAPK